MSKGAYIFAVVFGTFLILFSIPKGCFPSATKQNSIARRSNAQASLVVEAPKENAAAVPTEPFEQQLRVAQIEVATLSGELKALRLQRVGALTEVTRLSNLVARTTRDSDALRKQAAAALEEAKAEILARSRRIEVLEGEIGSLTQQVRDLAERLGRQDVLIAETERKRASTDAERVALKATLEALQAERRVLEARFNAKESILAEVKRQRNSESAARDSLFRRNWLAKPKSADAERPSKVHASKPRVSKPGAVKVRVDVSEVTSSRGKGFENKDRTNVTASTIPTGKSH